MILLVFCIIIDLYLNLNTVQNEVFSFPGSIQAPLATGEVLWLFAEMLNLEGGWEANAPKRRHFNSSAHRQIVFFPFDAQIFTPHSLHQHTPAPQPEHCI